MNRFFCQVNRVSIFNVSGKSLFMLLGIFTLPVLASAQNTTNDLNSFLRYVQTTFETGTREELETLFPLDEQKNFFKILFDRKYGRKAGITKILEANADSATVLITGRAVNGDWAVETFFSAFYFGTYQLKKSNEKWAIYKKIPIDHANKIRSHALHVNIRPGKGIVATDTMTADVRNKFGFFTVLNQRAVINKITLEGKPLEYTFNDGLLWINLKTINNAKIVFNYSMYVSDKEKRSSGMGYFADSIGHTRQNFWHPHFSLAGANDRADFLITAQIPAEYHLVTSIPQSDQVNGNTRIIKGFSAYPVSYLGLYYDTDWQPTSFKHGKINIEIFAAQNYDPKPQKLFGIVTEIYDLMIQKFGEPQSNYLGIVQNRSIDGNGWHNRTNDIIVSSRIGTYNLIDKPFPRAIIGHEVAHAWTIPTGSARLFLMEGMEIMKVAYRSGMILLTVASHTTKAHGCLKFYKIY